MPKGSPELTAARKEEIMNACEQLYRTMIFKEITLKEIAANYGFCDEYHFGKCYKKVFGHSPKRGAGRRNGGPGTLQEQGRRRELERDNME